MAAGAPSRGRGALGRHRAAPWADRRLLAGSRGCRYPINPKSLDRARDRFRVSGAKSDPFDAQVLALFLRSDHLQLRPLRPNSEAAQELKGLTRDYRRQVHLQTRLLNQLTATLKEYYPRALELCEDLTADWAQAFLARYPTPRPPPP